RLLDLLAEIGFGGLLHLLENHGRNLRGRILLALGFDPGIAIVRLDDLVGDKLLVLLDRGVIEAATDKALDGKQGVFGIGDRLALGRLAYKALVRVGESNDGRRGTRTLRILDDLYVLAVHAGDAGIGGSEVDTDDFCHLFSPLSRLSGPIPAFQATAPVHKEIPRCASSVKRRCATCGVYKNRNFFLQGGKSLTLAPAPGENCLSFTVLRKRLGDR